MRNAFCKKLELIIRRYGRALSLRTPHIIYFFPFGSLPPENKDPTDFLCASAQVLRPKRKMKYSPFHALHSSLISALTWLTWFLWFTLEIAWRLLISFLLVVSGVMLPHSWVPQFLVLEMRLNDRFMFFSNKIIYQKLNRQKLGLVPFRPKRKQQQQFFISFIISFFFQCGRHRCCWYLAKLFTTRR